MLCCESFINFLIQHFSIFSVSTRVENRVVELFSKTYLNLLKNCECGADCEVNKNGGGLRCELCALESSLRWNVNFSGWAGDYGPTDGQGLKPEARKELKDSIEEKSAH